MTRASLQSRVTSAVKQFWAARESQGMAQGRTGNRDAGQRTAVTGGKQLDGFRDLIAAELVSAGVMPEMIYHGRRLAVLPGWFRATKEWDLVVVRDGHLLAGIELKSQVGSFSNKFNNRTEEAIGSATDFWTAYREGAFAPGPRPWLGYLMLLEDCAGSATPVKAESPHFSVDQAFQGASYQERYRHLCLRMVRERLYDTAAFITTPSEAGQRDGKHNEPESELAISVFLASLRRAVG